MTDAENAAGDKQSRQPTEAERAAAREAVARIRAMSKGVTLGGLKIKDLINEGRR